MALAKMFRQFDIFMTSLTCTVRAKKYSYTAKVEDRKNPLAWPMMATDEDLKGMKPVREIIFVLLVFFCQ